MDDIKLALLGDKAAQERLTERGELLPCAHCKGNGKVSFKDYRFIGKNFKGDRKIVYRVQIICNKCRSRGKPIFTGPLVNPNPYITKWGNCYADTDVCTKGGKRAMTRAMQGPCEEIEQTCLFRWAALESGAHPELALLHAIPNGGKRSKSEAARMKAAGVKPGVPDMFLPVAREGCHGLYIELKRRDGGRVSTEQTAWMEALARQGYKTALCHGWDAAREEIQRYLGGKWSCG